MTKPLPDDWKRLLDGMEKRLQALMKEAEQCQPPGTTTESPPNESPLSATMKRIHDGLDERLARLEQHLQNLDQDLAVIELQAVGIQQMARLPEAQPAS